MSPTAPGVLQADGTVEHRPGLRAQRALSTRREMFRTWWAAHNVRFHRTGIKRLHHPVVGDLSLTCEALDQAEISEKAGEA